MNIKVDLRKVKAGLEKLTNKTRQAAEQAMKNTVVLIANESIKESPHITGHNRRSIAYSAGGKGMVRKGREKTGEKPFNEGRPPVGKLQGEIYSTSGYGGYLETGTVKMPARPYMKPALDRNFPSKFVQFMKESLRW